MSIVKRQKKKKTYKSSNRSSYSRMTGEDIAMFNEVKYESETRKRKNTCDRHIDGA